MKIAALISLIVIGCVCGAIISLNTTKGQQKEDPSQVVSKDEPTVIKKGQYSKKEKEYSKYYRKLYSYRDGEKLTEVNEPGGLGISIGSGHEPSAPNQPKLSEIEFLTKESCQADTILVGEVSDKKSHLTDDETFIFTSYNFKIIKIVKDDQTNPLTGKKKIEITRPGGFIKIEDQLIKLNDESFETLENNKKYLLFLKYIPEADGYVVSNARSDFEINDNDEYQNLSKQKYPKELRKGDHTSILISQIQSSLVGDCRQYKIGGQ